MAFHLNYIHLISNIFNDSTIINVLFQNGFISNCVNCAFHNLCCIAWMKSKDPLTISNTPARTPTEMMLISIHLFLLVSGMYLDAEFSANIFVILLKFNNAVHCHYKTKRQEILDWTFMHLKIEKINSTRCSLLYYCKLLNFIM